MVQSDRRQFDQPALAAGAREVWLLDAHDPDQDITLSAGLVLRGAGSWFWLVVSGEGTARLPVTVLADDGPVPRWPRLEIRAPGLWTEIGIQTPGRHLTLDTEAFGIEVDDPSQLTVDGRGVRLPVGTDVEWHAVGDAEPLDHGHVIPARVEGEVVLDRDTFELAATTTGSWTHYQFVAPPG